MNCSKCPLCDGTHIVHVIVSYESKFLIISNCQFLINAIVQVFFIL